MLNIRAGAILLIKVDVFEYLKGNILMSNKHKTGYINSVALRIHPNLITPLDAMLEKFESLYDKRTKLLFASSSD